LNRQQLDIREIDLDIAGDDQPFVEDAVEDVYKAVRARWINELGQSGDPRVAFPLEVEGRAVVLSLTKSAQWTEIDIEIFVREPEGLFELVHSLVELQESEPKSFYLFVGQSPAIHSTDGLVLQNFPQQFYHGQHESRKTVFNVFGVSIDAVGQGASERVQRHIRRRGRTYRTFTVWGVGRGDRIVAFTHHGSGC
jgi:hypothetical protein